MHDLGWRRTLRRELSWLLVLKFAALALLWWLFFSPAHRAPVDAQAESRRLGVTRAPTHAALVARPAPPSSQENGRE